MLNPGDIIYGFAKKLYKPIVCRLDEKEYIELIYAMYRSKRTPPEYKPYLDKILSDYYK